MTTVRTPIIDKNGKATHVHKRVATVKASATRGAAAPTPARPASAKPAQPDEHGFDSEGVHSITGTRLDPQGFNWKGWNEAGIHRDTGEKWDERGWQRDGLHRETRKQTDPDGRFKNGTLPGEAEATRRQNDNERAARREAKRVSISIPYSDTAARARAKELGWNPTSKTWSLKPEHAEEIEALISATIDADFQDAKERMRLQALQDHLAKQQRAALEASAIRVTIPYEGGEDARTFIKTLGARWEPNSKTWLLPPDGFERWNGYREANPEPKDLAHEPGRRSRAELAELAEDGVSVPENRGMAPWESDHDDFNPFEGYHHIDDWA